MELAARDWTVDWSLTVTPWGQRTHLADPAHPDRWTLCGLEPWPLAAHGMSMVWTDYPGPPSIDRANLCRNCIRIARSQGEVDDGRR